MSPVSGEHDDQYRRDLGRLDEALDVERRAIDELGVVLEPIGAVLAGTEDAIERLHDAWDVGFQDAITRLDEIRVQVDGAVRQTEALVARHRATR